MGKICWNIVGEMNKKWRIIVGRQWEKCRENEVLWEDFGKYLEGIGTYVGNNVGGMGKICGENVREMNKK